MVIVRRQLSRHGSEIEFLKRLKLQLEAGDLNSSLPAVGDLDKRVASLQIGDAGKSIQESEDAPDATRNKI